MSDDVKQVCGSFPPEGFQARSECSVFACEAKVLLVVKIGGGEDKFHTVSSSGLCRAHAKALGADLFRATCTDPWHNNPALKFHCPRCKAAPNA